MVACDGAGIGAHDNIRLLSGTVLHGMTSVEVTVTVGAMTGVEDSDPSCIAATPLLLVQYHQSWHMSQLWMYEQVQL